MSSATTTHDISVPQGGPRLLIGGVMLAVMAAWVYVNHDPAPVPIVAMLAVAAAAGAALGVAGLREPSSRRSSGFIALAGGLIAGGAAVWLATQFKLNALGETLGLGMFAILAIASGVQDRAAGLSAEAVWAKVHKMRSLLGMAVAALGVAGMGTFFYCAFVQKVGVDNYAPELIGLMLAGFLLFFAGFYLLASKDTSPEAGSLRTFFIIIGSLLGAVITFVSIGRAIFWNTEIFRSGVTAWSGSEAWRFWLVAYLFLAGIGLIYASLNLSLSQVRADPFLRRTLFGYRSVIAGVLLLILLAFTNFFIALKVPFTFDWSKARGMTALNAGTKNLLAGLTEPVGVYVLMSPGGPIYNDIRNFVGNCQAYTNKILPTYIDPDNDPAKYNKLAIRFKEIVPEIRNPFDDDVGRGVLLVNGAIPDDPNQTVPHVFIPEKKLYEFSKAGPKRETLILKAEAEIIKELAFLVKKSEKRKIYLFQGDGALDMTVTDMNSRRNPSSELAKLGAAKLVEKLKNDNYDIMGLSFDIAPKDKAKDVIHLGSLKSDKKPEIPDDCDVLFLPGPSGPVSQAALDAMERYMDRGGKMIVAIEVITDTQFKKLRTSGLEDFVKKYGVTVTDQILYRAPQARDQGIFGRNAGDWNVVLALTPPKAATVLAKQFKGVPFRLWWTRVVKAGGSTKYQVEPLLTVIPPQPMVWADDNLAGLLNFKAYTDDLVRTGRIDTLYPPNEPLPVAVTVTESSGEAAKPRMVVFGDAEFLANEDINAYPANYDIAASSIEWMISERGFVGPKAKESSRYSFGPSVDLERMVYGAFWTMLVLIVILGVGVWLARRK